MSLWPPGWCFCQPVPPSSGSLSWPCSRLPQVISSVHKGTHALTRILGTKTKVKCIVFPLSHGRSSVHLVSRRDPSACRKAERGVLLIHELSSELPRSRACARRGPAARGWKQLSQGVRAPQGVGEGLQVVRERLLRGSWEPFPTHWQPAGSGTMVYHHMSKIGGISPLTFTSLIFHKDQLL